MVPINAQQRYRMRISRLTIDKLGIRLYDKVAAVLSELIANAYDADAETVKITLPLGEYLATKAAGGVVDRGYEIRVEDDGYGMTADDVNAFYLHVGINRRSRGEETPGKNRKVMGRKGIGKLAPFGICHEIEVVTAGGEANEQGYPVSNLILRLEEIVSETDEDYFPTPGPLDGTWSRARGTTIMLRKFEQRRVPPAEDLHRQLAARFGIERADWRVTVIDSRDPSSNLPIGALPIDLLEGTRIDLSERPVKMSDTEFLPVSGWIAYAKDPYKDDAMAGVRVFARGKLVAQTRDFDVGTGFTGEFKVRSYVVGEVHADWLDEGEDLIRSDRQDIIWNSERGDALQSWGQGLIKEIAAGSEARLNERTWEEFLSVSKLEERLQLASPKDAGFRDSVRRAAKLLVRRNDREAILRDPDYVQGILDLSFAIGPHEDLLRTLNEASTSTSTTLGSLIGLFSKARVAEVYSLGQVASERIRVVNQLERLINDGRTLERDLQELVEQAPWIIAPEWTPLALNEPLAEVRRCFEGWYEREYRQAISTTTIDRPTKKPDFVMLSNEGVLEIVEIKRPDYGLTDAELDRAIGYLEAIRRFFDDNPHFKKAFHAVRLTIVCDQVGFSRGVSASALANDPAIRRKTWHEILKGTLTAHQEFLHEVRRMQGLRSDGAATDQAKVPGA
jgi:hypothetical protein